MQCSREIKFFIFGGIAIGAGAVALVPFTSATGKKNFDPQIVASLSADDANFKKLDETSGIAIAGFRDREGRPLLWAHNEKTSHISLISTAAGGTLYAGAIAMPGKRTRDAEDIAAVHENGKGTIYLADTGANRKDRPACVHYARDKQHPSKCSIVDADVIKFSKKDSKRHSSAGEASKKACLARGDDWLWLSETDYLAPGVRPAIRRMAEPTYQDALRGRLAIDTEVVEFEYPRLCGDRSCREQAGNTMAAIAPAYNTEALAVVVEPDHSHTAYLFTKAPPSLSHFVQTQHAQAAGCRFESDGLSDVFRLRNIDSLSSHRVHQAEYVTTLDLSDTHDRSEAELKGWRVTAANFLKLSGSQGLLLVRTTGHAYKWAVALTDAGAEDSTSPAFDVAKALTRTKPIPVAVPIANKMQGVSKKNQEAVAQLDESTVYYMGECKRLRECSLTLVRDNHPYVAGDVDGDGRVDANDVAAIGKFLAHEIDLYCKAAADVNGDARITAADLDYLKRYLEGRGPAPVPSNARAGDGVGPSCGYYNVANRK